MEALFFPAAPTLLALLVGIAFLYRFWPHLVFPGPTISYPKKAEALTPILEVVEDDKDEISKESDFPEGWWASKDVFELERRAIFIRSREVIDSTRLENVIGRRSSMPFINNILNHFQTKSEQFPLFPFAYFHSIKSTGFWIALSFLPVSEQKTALRYDLYCFKDKSACSREIADSLVDLLKETILKLEAEYQSHASESGGPVLPVTQFNSSETQKNILNQLKAHLRLEKMQGTKVFPAMRKPRENPKFHQAEQLCKELDCKIGLKQNDLAW
ncbi:hypothetical protein BBP40_006278 [Aspergillus hancockii]|nr:hypothetical protein BBP40_006278 [Aspergillus hancockii]